MDANTRSAANLRRAIDAAGGLVSQADLARRWEVSTPRVVELTRAPDFPAPILKVGRSVFYAGAECDAWRTARHQRR